MTHQSNATSYDFEAFPTVKNWVGGQWIDGSGVEQFDIINPRHGKVMATCGSSTAADVQHAVEAAKVNLQEWQSRPIRERAEVFYNLRGLMHQNLEELYLAVSHENGKTYAEAKAEVLKGHRMCGIWLLSSEHCSRSTARCEPWRELSSRL